MVNRSIRFKSPLHLTILPFHLSDSRHIIICPSTIFLPSPIDTINSSTLPLSTEFESTKRDRFRCVPSVHSTYIDQYQLSLSSFLTMQKLESSLDIACEPNGISIITPFLHSSTTRRIIVNIRVVLTSER